MKGNFSDWVHTAAFRELGAIGFWRREKIDMLTLAAVELIVMYVQIKSYRRGVDDR